MDLKNRSYKKELLDGNGIPFEDIQRNMQELNFINTYLGGHGITLAGFKKLLGPKKNVHVCEIGCGGGDNLLAILKWCAKHGVAATFTGIDWLPTCIEFARSRKALSTTTTWICADYRTVHFAQRPDIIFSSLFCHHFTEEELIPQLQWMRANSSTGFFINDLQRHWLAFASIRFLTQLFSRSYLVKNDAPLSVARGFHKVEWRRLLLDAGLTDATIQWKWAFRYLISCKTN